MAKRISLSRGVEPETVEQLKALAARWNCSEGEAIDRAVALAAIEGPDQAAMLSEVLELVRSLPDREDIEMVVDVAMQRKIDERAQARATGAGQNFNPASVPGVQRGPNGLQPRRETNAERNEREKLARADRVRALDSIDDPSIDRGDEFVS